MARLTEQSLSAASSVDVAPILARPYPHHLTGRPSNNRHTPENFAARFWRKVDQRGPDECWPWKGTRLRTGRGQVHLRWEGKKNVRATAPAVAWVLTHGPIPSGLVPCHNCPTGDDPNCVNPTHLFLGTQAENVHDSVKKGRFSLWRVTGVRLNGEPVRGTRPEPVVAPSPMSRVFERVPHVDLYVHGEVA